ncbi:MAG TPA: hypothetical protein VHZ26_09150 [Caulobacteraceae bacterium]|jgi:hypothetical protein|nr:hypothetical protein [Caulobacteraceae bacterium]
MKMSKRYGLRLIASTLILTAVAEPVLAQSATQFDLECHGTEYRQIDDNRAMTESSDHYFKIDLSSGRFCRIEEPSGPSPSCEGPGSFGAPPDQAWQDDHPNWVRSAIIGDWLIVENGRMESEKAPSIKGAVNLKTLQYLSHSYEFGIEVMIIETCEKLPFSGTF